MIPERYPLLLPRRNPHLNKSEWFERSDLILSISNSAADDMAFFFPKIKTPIKVIHLSTSIHNIVPSLQNPINFPFWLYVGKRVFYKNFQTLLIALCRVKTRYMPHLICAGGKPFSRQERELFKKLNLEQQIHQMPVNDFQLAWLYRNAEAVLVPSMSEGFSLPLIEAFACNTPVICSDIEVHREVGGEFATFLPGLNSNAWADFLTSESTRNLVKPKKALGDHNYQILLGYYSQNRISSEHSLAYSMVSS
jgi:glycosyltransferase involved in cell wall biosynthesis